MSRRRAGLSPSLFPFLAVLICTLGTLILLLALVAQDAKEAVVAEAEQERIAAAASPQAAVKEAALKGDDAPAQMTAVAAARLIEQEQFRVKELISYRDQQTADLEKKRDEITQVESHMRKIKEKLSALNTEVEMATASTDKPDRDHKTDEQTLLLMREEAEKLRADIKELESSERGSKPRVVIVPHRGPNGTQRRPVYVICEADGLRVMPEGVQITKAQALAATESDNPLSNPLGSALRVARRFAVEKYGDREPPYPLLIVRPNGIYMYRVASALMKDWDDQYGYELVPGEVELAFPGGDQVLRKDMEVAVKEAAARNYSFVGGGSGGGGRGRGHGDGSGDGFGAGMDDNAFAAGAPGPGGAHHSGSSEMAGGDTTGNTSDARPPRSLPTLSARELDRQAQSKGYSPARDQRFAAGIYSEPPGSRNTGYGAAPMVQSQSDALNDFLEGKSSMDAEGSQGQSGGVGSGEMENAQAHASLADDGNSAAMNGGQNGGQHGGPGGEGPNGQANIDGGDSPTGKSATAAMSLTQPQSNGQPGLPEQSASANSAGNANPVAMALTDAQQSGSPQSGSTSGSNEPSSASTSAPATPQVAQNMVRPEGQDWALPDAFRGMGGTEFIRPISMRCHHDRFELIEQGRVVQTFPFGEEGTYRPTIQLATAIRDRVANWGATMQGGYWKPRLEVSVGPHAESRYLELEKLMQNSGVEVIRRLP